MTETDSSIIPSTTEQVASSALRELRGRPQHNVIDSLLIAQPTAFQSELSREPSSRFAISELKTVFDNLRKQIELLPLEQRTPDQPAIKLFHALINRSNELIKKLDELDKQLDTQLRRNPNIITVGSEKDHIGAHKVPLVELDLRTPEEKAKDEPPVICMGGAVSGISHNLSLWQALALGGRRVIIIPYPEMNSIKSGAPKDWSRRVAKYGEGTFKLHEEYVRQIFQKLNSEHGISTADIFTHSAGFLITANALTQNNQEPPIKIRDIVAAEPIGFVEDSFRRMSWAFGVTQGRQTRKTTADTIQLLKQGENDSFFPLYKWPQIGRISYRQQITPKILTKLDKFMSGHLSIFLGTDDPVIPEKAIEAIIAMISESSISNRSKIHLIKGADHAFPVTHATGFISYALQDIEKEQNDLLLDNINQEEFAYSAAEQLLVQAKRGEL